MPSLLGTVALGPAITLFEDFDVTDAPDGTLTITARASPSVMSNSRVEDHLYDLEGLAGRLIPVTFSDKAFLSGYYTVADVDINHWSYPGLVSSPRSVVLWAKVTLVRAGTHDQVDLESRLSGALTRANAFSIVGERWHAPPPGHYAYYTSSGTPSTLSVTGAEGALTIYRGLNVGVNPRWACSLASWGAYRVRLLDAAAVERTGIRMPLAATGWEVNNGLVRLRVDSGGLKIASHDGTSYEEKTYNVTIGSVLGVPLATTVIRNTPEAVTVRCLWSGAPGRTTIDLTLRRGARFVEGYIQTQPSAASIVVSQAASEATTSATGYIAATANDGAGNRYMIGSAGAFTANTGARSITKSSATAMDFMAGATIGAGATGDTATDLMKRYIGATAENVQAVRR